MIGEDSDDDGEGRVIVIMTMMVMVVVHEHFGLYTSFSLLTAYKTFTHIHNKEGHILLQLCKVRFDKVSESCP